MADFLGGLGSLADLYGQYQSYQNASSAAGNINGISNASTQAYQNQLQALQNQNLTNNDMRDTAWRGALGGEQQSDAEIRGNIGNMTTNMNALLDPNSAYMQQARQAIERKDAAAGRRSQWGDREVQLQGTLAQQYNQYAPGMQNAITAMHNQLLSNDQGMASIWNNYSTPINNTNTNMTSLINQGGQNQVAMAQAAMGAMNNANNQQNGMLGSLIGAAPGVIKGIGSIWDMFGGGGGGSGGSDTADVLGDYGSEEGWW